MGNSEEFILAQWLSGKVDDKTVQSLLPDVDLENLRLILSEQEKIDFKLHKADLIWENLEHNIHKTEPENPRKSWIPKLLMAIFILCVALLSLYLLKQKPKEEIINTVIATTTVHELIDGSIIKLAPSSEIIYSPENWMADRTIKLKGQAFFNVKPGSSFRVLTELGAIEVLGTEFEVFELEDNLIVNCFEGKVKVESSKNKSVILNAQKQVRLNKAGFSTVVNINQLEAGFLSGIVKYKDITARLLLQELQRFYNLRVETENIDLEETFTGIIATTDIEKTCSYIAKTYDWKYQLDQDKVFFSK